MSQGVRRRERGFSIIELLIVLVIISILASIAVPNLLEARERTRRASLTADGRTLFVAIFLYGADRDSYPPCCAPPEEALDLATLHPLTTLGYLHDNALTRNLQGGQLSLYASSGTEEVASEFYAVMTDVGQSDLVLIVADTDDFPGHEGEVLHGLYMLEGESLIPVTRM